MELRKLRRAEILSQRIESCRKSCSKIPPDAARSKLRFGLDPSDGARRLDLLPMAADKSRKINYSRAWAEARELVWQHRRSLSIGLALMLVNRLTGLVLPA